MDLLECCGDKREEVGLGKVLLNLGFLDIFCSHFICNFNDLEAEGFHFFFALGVCIQHVLLDSNIGCWSGINIDQIEGSISGIDTIREVGGLLSLESCVVIGNVVTHQSFEVCDFNFDFLFKDSCMVSGWHASFVELLSNLEFLDPLDGLVEDILHISGHFFLPSEESVDVVLSALLELGECLLSTLLEDFYAPLSCSISFLAARFIDLFEKEQLFIRVGLELLEPIFLLSSKTSDGCIDDKIDLF